MKLVKLGIIGGIVMLGTVALAQESEFQGKIQEDMDGYKAQIVEGCGTSDKLVMRYDGKLGSNPRESEKPDWNAVSTLCTSGLDAVHDRCINNKVLKKALSKASTIVCTKGHGTLDYKLKGGTLTFTLDPSFTKNNAAGQEADLVSKMNRDLDK